MKNRFIFLLLMNLIIFSFPSCIFLHIGSASHSNTVKNEKLSMKIKEQWNVLSPNQLRSQEVLSLDARADEEKNNPRGPLAPVAGTLVSLATDAVKNIIANDEKKYIADYQFGLTDLYFYDQLSNEGLFDPIGLQFSGFKLSRTFINKAGIEDTALKAEFELDTVKSYEIINNSMFRLRVKDFQLRTAKARIPKVDKKKLNMDIEITFLTSYINGDGHIYDSVVLGKFYLLLRNAPLDPADTSYSKYYERLKGSLLIGKSFIVPRSFGYHKEGNVLKPGFSQGAYSIHVKVKESTKDHFINKLVIENTNLFIDASGSTIKSTPPINNF
jgi:hypothetical protein